MSSVSGPITSIEVVDARIKSVLADPAVRTPLKQSLIAFLERDPVDAIHDAELLTELLRARGDAILADAGSSLRQ